MDRQQVKFNKTIEELKLENEERTSRKEGEIAQLRK